MRAFVIRPLADARGGAAVRLGARPILDRLVRGRQRRVERLLADVPAHEAARPLGGLVRGCEMRCVPAERAQAQAAELPAEYAIW
jgi:hypothetical protein